MDRHPGIEAVTRFFEHDHLPEPLRSVAAVMSNAKDDMLELIQDDDPELTVGLRKLLEAKDCFVRSMLAQENRKRNISEEGKPL